MIEVRAFPKGTESNHPDSLGMSLRDYFASKALVPLAKASLAPVVRHKGEELTDRELINKAVAEQAYKIADAMMEQREKRSKS